ncbi:MAG TPA: hypothetical protein VGK00_08870 [Anaerolineales bacterium]|jgi:hypothetical protein
MMNRKTKPTSKSADLLSSGYIDREPAQKRSLPAGPFKPGAEGREGSLLIFVPRNTVSTLINDLTGGYGYSHLAVDCGEIDVPTGKRVMVESTFGHGVHTSFQDEYGERKFVRIPLAKVGVSTPEFCACVRSKLGEKFDYEEALTIGLVHNPAKQICSDLATVCLPASIRLDISRYHRAGLLHPRAAIRLAGGLKLNTTFRLFVTPNGYAEYFGAPRGGDLVGPDQLAEPVLPADRLSRKSRFFGHIKGIFREIFGGVGYPK